MTQRKQFLYIIYIKILLSNVYTFSFCIRIVCVSIPKPKDYCPIKTVILPSLLDHEK